MTDSESIPKAQDESMPELIPDEDGIIHEHHYDRIVTKNAAMFVAGERKRLCGKDKKPLLVTFERVEGYAPETRDVTLETVLANVSALAYHLDSKSEYGANIKNLTDSFFSLTPWPIRVTVIDSSAIQNGVEWLKQYLYRCLSPSRPHPVTCPGD